MFGEIEVWKKIRKLEERIVGAGIDSCIDSEKVSHTEKIEDRETVRQRDRVTERLRD